MRCWIVLSGIICTLAVSGGVLEARDEMAAAAPVTSPACAAPLPGTPNTPTGTAMPEMEGMPGMTTMEQTAEPTAPTVGTPATPESMTGMTMVMGSPEPVTACATEVAVNEGEFFVRTTQHHFHAGLPYVFVVTNVGKAEHMFVIERLGANHEPLMQGEAMAMVHGIEPGQTVRLPWVFQEPGAYQLACHEPGHYEVGMVQTIAVMP